MEWLGGQAIPWNEVGKVRLRGDKLSPQGEGAIPEEGEYVPRDEEAAPQEQGSPMDEQSPGYEEHFHAISDESSKKRSSEPSGNDESTSSRQPEGIQTLEARVQQLEELTKDSAEALYGRVLQHVLHLEEERGPLEEKIASLEERIASLEKQVASGEFSLNECLFRVETTQIEWKDSFFAKKTLHWEVISIWRIK